MMSENSFRVLFADKKNELNKTHISDKCYTYYFRANTYNTNTISATVIGATFVKLHTITVCACSSVVKTLLLQMLNNTTTICFSCLIVY